MGRGKNKPLGWKFRHAPTPPIADSVAATATITGILDTSGIPAALDTNTIVIIDAVGLSKTYKFMNGGGKSNGDLDGGAVVIQLSGENTKEGLVDNIEQSIESSNGHNGSITVSRDGAVLTLTQTVAGISGNTTITFSAGINTSTELSKTNFTGGALSNHEDNTDWWKYRAKRNEILSSGDTSVDNSRVAIFSASVQAYNRFRFAPQRFYADSLSLRRDLNKRQFVFAETAPLTSNNIKTKTSTFAKDVISNDLLEANPQYKFKPEFRVERGIDNSSFLGKTNFPLAFYTSSVGSQNTDPEGYFKTTQHLQDYYLETKDIPLQGPFTEQHVGGYQYRHTGLNLGLASTRQEGWYTTVTKVGSETFLVIYNPSFISTDYPRATYSRDHIAKSYLNIKNIKNITSSNNPGLTATTNDLGSTIALGNYSHDYEIVQIPDRAVNNRYLVENNGVNTSSVASGHISGLYDRTVPDRGANKHIFVSRFSSPGGPDTMGAGYLDAESETFSVYNALPYRNLAVRSPLRTLLTKHSAFGGYDSVLGDGVAATATMTGILDDNTIPAALDTNTIVIIDAAGLSKTYKFMNGGGKSNGDLDGGAVVVQLSGEDSKEGLVDNIEQAIESSNGHNGSIIVERSGAVITLTQGIIGLSGNTTITFSAGINTSTELSKTNFLGGLPRIASFHKTQRNGAKRILSSSSGYSTGTVYDNAFVQHMIPQSDMQYSWITASATNVIFGYEQPNNSNASRASTDITFVSASDFGSLINTAISSKPVYGLPQNQAGASFYPQPFIPLNSFAFPDPTKFDLNTISLLSNNTFIGATLPAPPGTIPAPQSLNSQLLGQNGAGGFSSWKQVRQGDGPIPRYLRKTNKLSLVKETQTLITDDQGKQELIYPKTLISYTEPPISSKYKPLTHEIQLRNNQQEDGTGGEEIVIRSSYGNNLAYFTMTNALGVPGVFDSLTDKLQFQPKHVKQTYDDLKRVYIDNENGGMLPGTNPIFNVPSFTYSEVVYPRESYTFLAKTRMRENYGEAPGSSDFNRSLGKARTFWRDNSDDRLRSIGLAKNSMGTSIDAGTFKTTSYENVIDLSCWPLDANYPMVDIAPTGAGGVLGGTRTIGFGEGSLNLPSKMSLKSLNGELSYNNGIYNLYRVPIQGLNTSAPTTLNGTSPTTASLSYEYPNFVLSGSDPSQASMFYTMAHLNLIPNWTANLTSSRNPWFDSYSDYSNDIRRIGKDFTVIPEFRISDHMEYYLKEGFGAVNRKFMDLIGASTSITASADSENAISLNEEFYRIYSHTDFMKHFDVFSEDHLEASVSGGNSRLKPSKIKIKCKGIKKLLPYQGFYPALRTVQLGQLFSSSYGPHLTGTYNEKSSVDADQQTQQLSSLIQPFFAPGIMFNTIKSGIAVDWPVITGSIDEKTPLDIPAPTGVSPVYGYRATGLCNFHPDFRMPFEALVSPDKFLPVYNINNSEDLADRPDATIYHIWPNYPTASLGQSNQARRFSAPGVSEEFRNWYDFANYKRPSPNFAWKGQHDDRYNLAMSNFLAETIDFFLEDQQVTTFVSKPEKQFKTMVSGTTYFMDVVLSKTDGFKMFEGPDNLFFVNSHATGTSAGPDLTASVGARGMHYGPNFTSQRFFDDMSAFGRQKLLLQNMQDPGPAPYTPPYFYGTSIARVAFRPHALREMEPGDTDQFTLSEIFSSAEIETRYLNLNENSNGRFGDNTNRLYSTGSAAYLNQMSIKSSINLFQRTGQKKTTYIPIYGEDGSISYKANSIVDQDGTENDVWIIESKFECPTLDFSNHKILDTYSDGDGNERSLTTGMWRTYGQIPEQDAGIFLQIKNPFEQITNATEAAPKGSGISVVNPRTGRSESRGPAKIQVGGRAASDRTLTISTTGSLADICGFDIKKKRIGKLAESKVISEAIVAIPINSDGSTIKIPKKAFATQLNNFEKEGLAVKAGDFTGVAEDIKETSITDMIKKMKRFVIPPHLDFINNKDIDPFVMYIFDFNHKLSKGDLSLIWQNMMPDISVVAEEAESIIEHPILTGPNLEFFGMDPVLPEKNNNDELKSSIFPTNVRWMVFKVKQRGKNNYYGASLTQDDNKGFGLSELDPKGKLGVSGKQLAYSYNWPYDFFSLVELGKIETSIAFEPTKSDPRDRGDKKLEDRIREEQGKRRDVSREVKQKDQVNLATTSLAGNQEKK